VLYLNDNPGLDAFSIPPMPALQSLRLNSCKIRSLSPRNVISLAAVSEAAANTDRKKASKLAISTLCYSERFPLLKYLDLSGNFGFEPDTIPAMLFLNKLSLSNCDLVSLGSKSWSERFPRLELLEIDGNPKLKSLVKLKSVRQANMTLLNLDNEQTILPGFQIENYGEPEVFEKDSTRRSTVTPFRVKL